MSRVNVYGFGSVDCRSHLISECEKYLAGDGENRAFVIHDKDGFPFAVGMSDEWRLWMRSLQGSFGGQVDTESRTAAGVAGNSDESSMVFYNGHDSREAEAGSFA